SPRAGEFLPYRPLLGKMRWQENPRSGLGLHTDLRPDLGPAGRASEVFLDEAMLTYYQAPHSYTREDLAEISCHGNPVILDRALEHILRNGARLAKPGEFTYRAFLN